MGRHEDCEDVVAINESPTTIGVADSSSTNEEIPSDEQYRERGEAHGSYEPALLSLEQPQKCRH